MKILAIRGQNLASLAGHFEIRLDQPPLSDAGLFAITGATGSGKSTILDAMCLALFGQTPRFSGRSSVKIAVAQGNDQSKPLSMADPRHILRRGCGEGFAEVDFLGADGLHYRAHWLVRRSRGNADGNFQKAELNLSRIDGTSLGSHKKEETKSLIEKKLGLTFDQFCRSVLLAQGDFAAFLKAEPDDRASLLERMTGTEIYKRISELTHQHFKQAKDAWELQNAKLGNIELLDEASRQAFEEKQVALLESRKQLQDKKAGIERALNWYKDYDALRASLEQANTEKADLETTWEAMREVRENLERLMLYAPLRALFADRAQALKQVAETQQALQQTKDVVAEAEDAKGRADTVAKDAGDRLRQEQLVRESAQQELDAARQLDHELQRSEVYCKDLQEKVAEASVRLKEEKLKLTNLDKVIHTQQGVKDRALRWQERHPRWLGVAKDAAHWRNQLQQFEKLQAQHSEAQKTQVTLQNESDKLAQELDGLSEEAAQDRDKVQKLETQLAEQQKALGQIDSQRLMQQLEAQETALTQANAALEWHKTLEEFARQRDEQQALQAKQQKAKDDAETQIVQTEQALDSQRERCDEAKATLERLKATQDLASRRHLLQADEPCPLCGSTEHPYADQQTPMDQAVAEQQARVGELEKAIGEQTTALGGYNEAKKAAIKAFAECKETLGKIEVALETHRKDDQPSFKDKDAPAWQQQCNEAKAALKQLKQQRQDLEQLRGQVDQSQSALKQMSAPLKAIDTKIATKEKEHVVLQEKLVTYSRQVDALAVQLKAQQADFAVILDDDSDCDALQWGQFADTLEARIAVVEKRASDITKAKQALDECARQRSGLETSIDHLVAACSKQEAQLEQEMEAFAQLQKQREPMLRSFFPDMPDDQLITVDQANKRLKDAVERAQEAKDQAIKQANMISERLQDAMRKRDSQASLLEERETRQGQVSLQLEQELTKLEVEEVGVKTLLDQHDQAWVDGKQIEVDALKERRSKLETIVGERQRSLDAHAQKDPPTVEREELNEQLQACETELANQREEEKEIHAKLTNDDHMRKAQAEQVKELERLDQIKQSWEKLHDLIGSSDGKKFRIYAQSVTLDILLQHANHHLAELAPRYRLERVPGETMALQVIDTYMADEVRSVNSLSGGESFLASLALALGLSSLSAQGHKIGSLFIDEGFGTLDAETLEIALSALDALQAQGRQVGIISHVAGIAARIGVRVHLERKGQDASQPCIRYG